MSNSLSNKMTTEQKELLTLPEAPLSMLTLSEIKLAKRYQIKKQILVNNEGDIKFFEAINKQTKMQVAIKYIPYQSAKQFSNYFKHLVDNLLIIDQIKSLPKHKNILHIECAGIEQESKDFYEVLEYCDEGNLWDYCKAKKNKTLKPLQILEYMEQIANGLVVLHKNGIIHKDIKPHNILIKKVDELLEFKIGGYGHSQIKDLLKTSNPEIEQFIAPEKYNNNNKTNKMDIWGLGLTFHLLLFGELYFDAIQVSKMKEKKPGSHYAYPEDKGKNQKLPVKLKDLLEKMIHQNAENRYTAIEVLNIIRDINKELQMENNELNNSFYPSNQRKPYNSLSEPILLKDLKMSPVITVGGRGIVKLANDSEYFAMNWNGNLQKITAIDSIQKIKNKYELGKNNIYSSITINKSENCLLVSGCDNKNIFAVDPGSLEVKFKWENTHKQSSLRTIIFLDNDYFCAGYGDGWLKKFKLNQSGAIEEFKISQNMIGSFYVHENELLIGDSKGSLFSINWKTFKKNYNEIKIHKSCITSIAKSDKYLLTGSDDRFIVQLDLSKPPKILNKIKAISNVHQLLLINFNANLLVLCMNELLLYKYKNDEYIEDKKMRSCLTRNLNFGADGKNDIGYYLQSFTFLENIEQIIVCDSDGNIFSVKLEQISDSQMLTAMHKQIDLNSSILQIHLIYFCYFFCNFCLDIQYLNLIQKFGL